MQDPRDEGAKDGRADEGKPAGWLSSALQVAKRMVISGDDESLDAIELLKAQHREVEKLFEAIEQANEQRHPAQADALFVQLASKLVAHDAIEREIFYPACEGIEKAEDQLGEALAEHGIVEFALYEADQARRTKAFRYKSKALDDVVQHHVKEEEKEFFPRVEKALGKERLAELGATMRARFEQAEASDFRPPLHENLRQVLAGALKTKPAPRTNVTAATRALPKKKAVPKTSVARRGSKTGSKAAPNKASPARSTKKVAAKRNARATAGKRR